MVDVELQLEVGQGQLADQRFRIGVVIEEIARHVAAIDRLEQEIDAMGQEPFSSRDDRAPISRYRALVLARAEPGHKMQALHAGGFGEGECPLDAGLEVIKSLRLRGQAALAGGPIARVAD